MQSKQTRGLQSFRRVEAWFAEHPEVIPASGTSASAITKQLAALSGVVQRMTTQATEQATQKSQTTLAAKDESTLYKELRKPHMEGIVKVARALRGKVSGMGVFKLPSTSLSSESLVHAAEALRTTAAVYNDVFVEHGLPADFDTQLGAATAALKTSIDARGVAQSRRIGAGAGLVNDLALGKEIVSMIDASLGHVLKSDSATLAAWRQAKRVTIKGVATRVVGTLAPVLNVGVPVTAPGVPGSAGVTPSARSGVPVAPSAAPVAFGGGSVASGGVPVADGVVSLADGAGSVVPARDTKSV